MLCIAVYVHVHVYTYMYMYIVSTVLLQVAECVLQCMYMFKYSSHRIAIV